MQRNITGCWPIYSDLYRCICSSHNWMRRFTLFVAELVQQSHTVLGRCRPDSSRLLAPSPVYSFDILILMLTHPATLRLAICGGFNPLTTKHEMIADFRGKFYSLFLVVRWVQNFQIFEISLSFPKICEIFVFRFFLTVRGYLKIYFHYFLFTI